MFNEFMYHGTNKERGARILSSKEMECSTGDNHWLGDGSYFFDEEFYAYKWILDMCNDRYSTEQIEEALNENYQILIANVVVSKTRILDLTGKAEHKILFDNVYKELEKKKEYSDRFKSDEIAEGVVLNYMFNELNYGDDFDVVTATFALNRRKYKNVRSRIGHMPQKQFCVKEQKIVTDIKDFEYNEFVSKYKDLINNLYFDNGSNKTSYYNKNRSQKNIQTSTYTRKRAYVNNYKV